MSDLKIGDKVYIFAKAAEGYVNKDLLETEQVVTGIYKQMFVVGHLVANALNFETENNHWCRILGGPIIHTNKQGGKQTDVPYAFHLLPAEALLAVARVIKEGHDKYDAAGEIGNWKKIPLEEHVNHNIGHSYLGLSGNTEEEHFTNAACRALFALQMYLEREQTA